MFAPVIVGIDVGLTGDPSVVATRQGRIIRKVISIPAIDPMLTASRISQVLKQITPEPTTIFGDAGQGMAVLSRLRDLGHHNVIDVFFNAVSDEPNCFNKRASMAYRLKKFTQEGQLPEDDELLQECVNQFLEDDPNHKIRIIKKRKIRDIIGRSPDKFDACCLTFAEPDQDLDDMYQTLKTSGLSATDLMALRQLQAIQERSAQDDASTYDPTDYMDKIWTTEY
jgi:hypothetical protein